MSEHKRIAKQAEILGFSFTTSGLYRMIKNYQVGERFILQEEALRRVQSFFGLILAGASVLGQLVLPEEWRRLRPEGAGLDEAVWTYSRARKVWSSGEVGRGASVRDGDDFVSRMRAYAASLPLLEGETSWDNLAEEERKMLEELARFSFGFSGFFLHELNALPVS